MKDIGWFTADGAEMNEENWAVQNISAFGMFLNGQAVFDRSMQGERKENDSFLLLFNGGSGTIRFALPGPRWVCPVTCRSSIQVIHRLARTRLPYLACEKVTLSR